MLGKLKEVENEKEGLSQHFKANEELNKELVLYKEKTYDLLEKYSEVIELLENEMQQNKNHEKEILNLNSQITKLEQENKSIIRKLNALKKSKLGRLTMKYWSIRKKLSKGAGKN